VDDSGCIGRILKKRKTKMMSEGGMVANGGDDDYEDLADSRPNNFDDLSLRDDLEFSLDSKNSGDELGNDQQDEDRRDAVARIMRQRAMKKSSNPKPA
jgi:hypothetical protein